ncbi:MGMT family protein [Candidatus Woesearchaeota archaeon]|nr:MGMT family protein [Candidatus Woesearchaeota archaeon]
MTFNSQVWELCKQVPRGKVTTYGEIARALGCKAYQAVGNAMNKNPYGAGMYGLDDNRMVPCHRVVNSDGKLGGFARGADAKKELLQREGVAVVDGRVDLKRHLHRF